MCGIAGIFNLVSDSPPDTSALRRAISRMALRGPDDRGIHEAPGVALGHRRLAIIDLSAGCQPFTDPASGATLVFNGEIFNYRELRADLETRGVRFRTQSDTEVLLQAWLAWGSDCLRRLNGMFAFAIHDPRDRSLFAARDRVGVKPYFYAVREGRFLFASSMAALLCLLPDSPRLAPGPAAHYLTTLRTTLGRDSLICGIHALLPGECLQLRAGDTGARPRRYWDFPVVAPDEKPRLSLDEAAARARELLDDSVRLQLISDVPLGGFLSGGLDSVILAALASRQTGGHYNAYSVGYDQDGYNEWPFIEEAAARYGLWCKQIRLQPEAYPGDWKFLVQEKGLPLSTPNEVPIYHLAKALRNDFTVALSGEGADEIFGGYSIPYFSSHDYTRAAQGDPSAQQLLQRLYGVGSLPDPVTHHFLLNSWMPASLRRQLVAPPFRADDQMLAWYEEQYRRVAACSPLDQRMHVHARVNLEGLLFRVDSSTMAASVEARVPFTDHRLIELLFTLPDDFKIAWNSPGAETRAHDMNIAEIDQAGLLETKRLLRHAFRDDVPSSILHRRKMSFPVPVFDWIGGPFAAEIRQLVADSPLCGTLFSPDALAPLLEHPGQPANAMALWPIANLCIWQQRFGIQMA